MKQQLPVLTDLPLLKDSPHYLNLSELLVAFQKFVYFHATVFVLSVIKYLRVQYPQFCKDIENAHTPVQTSEDY